MSDTPETEIAKLRAIFPKILEALQSGFCSADCSLEFLSSIPKEVELVRKRLECERDGWKAKFIRQNKDLGCEMMDPNGTIWDHTKKVQQELNELIAAASTLKQAKGRLHTQQAATKLFNLLP
jgi:hypothetical protein